MAAAGGLYVPRGILIKFESIGGEEFEVVTVYEPCGACSDAACCDREFFTIFVGLFWYVETSSVV